MEPDAKGPAGICVGHMCTPVRQVERISLNPFPYHRWRSDSVSNSKAAKRRAESRHQESDIGPPGAKAFNVSRIADVVKRPVLGGAVEHGGRYSPRIPSSAARVQLHRRLECRQKFLGRLAIQVTNNHWFLGRVSRPLHSAQPVAIVVEMAVAMPGFAHIVHRPTPLDSPVVPSYPGAPLTS